MRQLRIDVRHGSVALSGKLSRYYLLQLAQSAVLQTPGVSKLITTVNVVPVAADPQLAAG